VGWLAFNDFRVSHVTAREVYDASPAWRTPCALVYQSEAAAGAMELAAPPLGARALGRLPEDGARAAAGYLYPAVAGAPHAMAAFAMRIPLATAYNLPPSIPHQPALGAAPPTPHASPAWEAGAIMAIDAEFVATAAEASRVRADGSRQVVDAAVLSPGRVSVVADDGALVLDAYVATMEPVVDHLTRFSGLQVGDLEVTTSRHRLHTFKDTYIKLRALVDAGVRFVGHGLRKDFRTLNLLVAPPQVIDTVTIYKLDGQRNLSLKYLAANVLGADIQGVVHDSGEDALMALHLYQRYREEVAADASGSTFGAMLEHLYTVGRANGFRPAGTRTGAGTAAGAGGRSGERAGSTSGGGSGDGAGADAAAGAGSGSGGGSGGGTGVMRTSTVTSGAPLVYPLAHMGGALHLFLAPPQVDVLPPGMAGRGRGYKGSVMAGSGVGGGGAVYGGRGSGRGGGISGVGAGSVPTSMYPYPPMGHLPPVPPPVPPAVAAAGGGGCGVPLPAAPTLPYNSRLLAAASGVGGGGVPTRGPPAGYGGGGWGGAPLAGATAYAPDPWRTTAPLPPAPASHAVGAGAAPSAAAAAAAAATAAAAASLAATFHSAAFPMMPPAGAGSHGGKRGGRGGGRGGGGGGRGSMHL